MDFTVRKSKVEGRVTVPSSKSILQRYMIAAFLAEGNTTLLDVFHCSDTIACLQAIDELSGFKHEFSNAQLKIKGSEGRITAPSGTINCRESGFALRSLAAVSGLSEKKLTLTGEGSLLRRPMGFIENVFNELNIFCRSSNGFLPLEIKGPAKFKDITLDASITSQFLSGLLMIYPFAKEDHTLNVLNLRSKFYIDLTMDVLRDFGIIIHNRDYKEFHIPGNQRYKACKASIEGDWSAASFMLVAGAIAGEVTVTNISMHSHQPDKEIIKVLENAGANIRFMQSTVSSAKKNLYPFSFDATDCPDLFPPLVALAIHCPGRSEIAGVERLIHKESNRALALQQEFSKLNNKLITMEGNKMIIQGGLPLKNAVVESHNDHRIAMALAIAGLLVEDGITITGTDAVAKSYPEFFTHLSSLIT